MESGTYFVYLVGISSTTAFVIICLVAFVTCEHLPLLHVVIVIVIAEGRVGGSESIGQNVVYVVSFPFTTVVAMETPVVMVFTIVDG